MSIAERSYDKREVASFSLTNAPLGELSNFHPRMPLLVPTEAGLIRLDSSETWYQADKFRDRPEVQDEVIKAANAHKNGPRGGKDAARARNDLVSDDWTKGRSVQSMRYVLRLKYAQHREAVGAALDATGDRPIVEFSRHDAFWGAKPDGGNGLRGVNALGRLWMEIREARRQDPDFCRYAVDPYPTRLLGSPLTRWVRPAQVLNAHVVGKDAPGAVYVGRPSRWGNPVAVSEETPRGQALLGFLEYLKARPDLVDAARQELAGRDLICWCAPRACHAEVWRHVAEGNPVPDTWDVSPRKRFPDAAPDSAQSSFGF